MDSDRFDRGAAAGEFGQIIGAHGHLDFCGGHPLHAVGRGEHPALVDEHAAAELRVKDAGVVGREQGGDPRPGARGGLHPAQDLARRVDGGKRRVLEVKGKGRLGPPHQQQGEYQSCHDPLRSFPWRVRSAGSLQRWLSPSRTSLLQEIAPAHRRRKGNDRRLRTGPNRPGRPSPKATPDGSPKSAAARSHILLAYPGPVTLNATVRPWPSA